MYKSVIVAISIAASFSWIAPAQAFPVMNAPVIADAPSDATQVDWHGNRNRVFFNHGGHDFRDRGRFGNRGGRYYGHGGYYRHGGYYGGYHNGGNAAAIIGGLAAGAIIGGALSAPRYSGSHAGYCANRYRTYRASDNTYQPSNGPRRQCR
jgi:hypothetical protein